MHLPSRWWVYMPYVVVLGNDFCKQYVKTVHDKWVPYFDCTFQWPASTVIHFVAAYFVSNVLTGNQTHWSKTTQCADHRSRNSSWKEQTCSRGRKVKTTYRSNTHLRRISSFQYYRTNDQSDLWTVWYYWYGTDDSWFRIRKVKRILFYTVSRSW